MTGPSATPTASTTPDPPAPASTGSPAVDPGVPSSAASGGEAATGDPGGGSPDAACYRGGDDRDPEDEPDDPPPEPEPVEAEEQVESESPEADEQDDCPVEQAVQQAEPDGGARGELEAASPTEPASGSGSVGGATGPRDAGPTGDARSHGVGAAPEPAEQDADGEAAAARVPLDAALQSVETARTDAVANSATAEATLSGAVASLNTTPPEVVFGGAGAAGGNDESTVMAGTRATGFIREGRSRAETMLSTAGQAIPERLSALAAAHTGAIGASIEASKDAISNRIAAARAAAVAQAAAARATVEAQHATSIATITRESAAAVDGLAKAHGETMAAVDDGETEALDTINTLYAAGRAAHEALGPTLAVQATARGESYAAAYEGCKIHRKDSFWKGHLTDRRAEAQQKAARETAKGYAKSLEEVAQKQAREAVKGRQKDRCAVIVAAGRARDTADGQLDALVTAIDASADQARQQADATRGQLLASIQAALTRTTIALANQQQQQRQAANDAGFAHQAAIEQAANEGNAALLGAAAEGADMVGAALHGIQETFAASAPPDPESLATALASANSALQGVVTQVESMLDDGLAGVGAHIETTHQGATAALDGVAEGNDEQAASQTTGFTGAFAALATGAVTALSGQREAFITQTTTATEEGRAGLRQVTTGFQEACEATITSVHEALSDSVEKLEASLRETLGGIDSPSQGIPKQAREAASHEQPAWKSVVKWVLIIAIVVVVALVIGPAVIGAVGAAAASLGAGAAATTIGTIVGGAIVGAATSATIAVVSNVAEGRTWHEGVGKAAIMGAIGGAFGAGAGALIGKYVATTGFQFAANIAADAVLEIGTTLITGEFSWEALGMAVLMSAATGGFGEIGAVKGIQGRFHARGAGLVGGGPGGAPRSGARTAEPSAPTRPGEAGGRPQADGPSPRGADGPDARRPGAKDGSTADAPRTEGDPAVDGAGRGPEVETTTDVGGTHHDVKIRQGPDGPEVWACSSACGPMRNKIDDILPRVNDPRVRRQLQDLKAEATRLEARIARGDYPDQASRLAAVRDLGDRLGSIGRADPRVGQLLEGGPDFNRLEIEVGEPRYIRPDNEASLDIPPGEKALYVVRDKATGEILKVGEMTTGTQRFDQYARAARRLGLDLEIEVRPVTLPPGQGIRQHEQALRDQVDWGGSGRLPWDNTRLPIVGNRLGRPGQGIPFVPFKRRLREAGWTWDPHGRARPPGATGVGVPGPGPRIPPADALRFALDAAGGNVRHVAQAFSRSPNTIYRWMRRYGMTAGTTTGGN